MTGPLASGPRWPKATCPGQRAPPRVRRHRGGSVTTRHLTLALSTARHLRSTCSPCSRRLHMLAAPLSRIAATPRPVPLLFLSSRQAPTPLCSASHHAPLIQASNIDHRAPPSSTSEPHYAGHDPEPSSSVLNHQSVELAAFFFTYRGRHFIKRHLWPPTCSSATAATSARAHRRSTNPEPAPSTSSPA
jgi:hypothetical protein